MRRLFPVCDTYTQSRLKRLCPLVNECASAICNCDPNGPLMMYVSKMRREMEKDILPLKGFFPEP